MRVGRVNWELRYAYFPNYSAPLLDKMVRFTTTNLELGGQAAAEVTPLVTTALYLPHLCPHHCNVALFLIYYHSFSVR